MSIAIADDLLMRSDNHINGEGESLVAGSIHSTCFVMIG